MKMFRAIHTDYRFDIFVHKFSGWGAGCQRHFLLILSNQQLRQLNEISPSKIRPMISKCGKIWMENLNTKMSNRYGLLGTFSTRTRAFVSQPLTNFGTTYILNLGIGIGTISLKARVQLKACVVWRGTMLLDGSDFHFRTSTNWNKKFQVENFVNDFGGLFQALLGFSFLTVMEFLSAFYIWLRTPESEWLHNSSLE